MPKTTFQKQEITIRALELSLTIDLKSATTSLLQRHEIVSRDPLTFKFDHEKNQYLAIFKYGVIGLINWSKEFEEKALNILKPFLNEPLATHHSEEVKIIFDPESEQSVMFDRVILPKFEEKSAIVIAVLLAQSVGLDTYEEKADLYLDEFKNRMRKLEKPSPFLPTKELIKQVNKTIDLQEDLIANLQVLDKPEVSWETAELDRLYHDLSKTLELPERIKTLSQKIELLKSNTAMALDIANNRSLQVLEVVFILIVAFEIILVVLEKLFLP